MELKRKKQEKKTCIYLTIWKHKNKRNPSQILMKPKKKPIVNAHTKMVTKLTNCFLIIWTEKSLLDEYHTGHLKAYKCNSIFGSMFSTKFASGDFDRMIFSYDNVKVLQLSFVCLIHSSKRLFSLQEQMTVKAPYSNSIQL